MLLSLLKLNKIKILVAGVILLNCCLAGLPQLANAKKEETNSREGLPTYRVGGGSRGGCLVAQNKLIALIPEKAIAKTAVVSPQLYFYVPEIKKQQTDLEFVLRDHQDQLMYETLIQTDGSSGIMSFDLPPEVAQKLETNKNYHWYLSLVCNPQNRAHDVVVEGWIQRVELEPTVEQQLVTATSPLEQAKIYRQQGIWHDALSILAEQKQVANPQMQVVAEWKKLLQSVGLDNLVQKQFIQPSSVSSTLTKTDGSNFLVRDYSATGLINSL